MSGEARILPEGVASDIVGGLLGANSDLALPGATSWRQV
jgi:hypothetical protein